MLTKVLNWFKVKNTQAKGINMSETKKVAYSEEQFDFLKNLYEKHCVENKDNSLITEVINEFNEKFDENKSGKSIRGVLVRRGVYNPDFTKPHYTRKLSGPSKKELLNRLEQIVEFDVNTLSGANKEGLEQLILWAEKQKVVGE